MGHESDQAYIRVGAVGSGKADELRSFRDEKAVRKETLESVD